MLFLQMLVFFCVCLLVRHVWYRRKFYYLSWKINGPFALPIIGNSFSFSDSSKVINTITEMFKQFNSPLRFWLAGNFMLIYDSPEDIETILRSPHAQDRGSQYKILRLISDGDGLLSMNGERWKEHRKLLNPTVQNYSILHSFYPKFNKSLRLMTDLLEKKVGKGLFDITESFEACSLDMICESTFGIAMNIQKGENHYILEHSNKCGECILKMTGILTYQPWYRLYPIYRLSKYFKIMEKSKRECREFVKNILDTKIEEFRNRNPIEDSEGTSNEVDEYGKTRYNIFIEEILRMSIDRNCFTEQEIITQSMTMLFTGFETNASTVSFIVLMLALHPEYQERVFQELREIFPEQRSDVTAEDISKFKYTEQFIKETMRFTTIVPILSRNAKKDFRIGKHMVPEGTELVVSIFHLHRNSAIYGDRADTFDPDHFLPEVARNRHPYSFIPFSAGMRNCIGLKYGHIVVRMFTAWLVRNYRFTTNLKVEELNFRMNVTIRLIQGHMVQVEKRENY